MASCATAVSAALVRQVDAIVERDIEQRIARMSRNLTFGMQKGDRRFVVRFHPVE